MPDLSIWRKLGNTLVWSPAYAWQRFTRPFPDTGPVHFIIGVADHFEPAILPQAPSTFASQAEQERRVDRWCEEYPKAVRDWPDSDGRFFPHTYFYPGEQYDSHLINRLAEHCHSGWGEIEIHLHHGVEKPDTSEGTRRSLTDFRDILVSHGCLSRLDGQGPPRFGFVHGNWALANSAGGRYCGVDDELQILSDTGCYADFTLPAAPSPAQVSKINAIYEPSLPLNRRAPHRHGRDTKLGRPPTVFPLIIQGPLALWFARPKLKRLIPYIENGELSGTNPPSLQRFQIWRRAAITVQGKKDWIFIKLHCHGMDPRDEDAMTGALMRRFLQELTETTRKGGKDFVHFVTMREMANMILAVCDGREGSPGEFRDYRLKLIRALDDHPRAHDSEPSTPKATAMAD
ncbi:MAG TPA: hypothetical protein VKV95_08235 [Terriglobia bacterium]|nr:hypothetical protein [Terriglobia bacterium]